MPDYEMYTEAGNQAVEEALSKIAKVSDYHSEVWNRVTLEAIAEPFIEEVAKIHGEVYDTEPRGHIADFLDRICKMNGWSYEEWDW